MTDTFALEEAVERARRGDREAFADIIRACHVPVRALLTTLVQNRHDADDLAQQTFVFAVRHLSEYRPGTHFLAWVKSIARNHAMDHLKRRRQRQGILERYARHEIARRAAERAGAGEVDLRLEMLQRCVQGLSEEQRAFLRRAHDRQLTLDRLAQELSRSGTAVRKQLSRLYESLRNCIERRAEGQGASL